jgi:Uma2 family endonuclease
MLRVIVIDTFRVCKGIRFVGALSPNPRFSVGYSHGIADVYAPRARSVNYAYRLRYDGAERKPTMRIEATKKLFTVDEYYRMAEVGILGPEDRVELIDGEIIEMSPIGYKHAGCVLWLTNALTIAFRRKALLNPQNPLRLSNYTEPEPDIVLLKPRKDAYRHKHVEAEDALLVIEVSDTTLRYDRDVKVPHYAAAGILEVWIVDLEHDLLLVYRAPDGSTYKDCLTMKRGDSVSAQAFPEITFKVDDILG